MLTYPNTLKDIALRVEDIEEQILGYDLEFIDVKSDKMEWKMKPPIFLYSFYSFLLNFNRIPTQEEFWSNYQHRAKEWIDENELTKADIRALKARAYRAYPSLVRDVHFSKLLEESERFELVYYNENLDVLKGIDIVVQKGGKLYSIMLFVKTARAFKALHKKKYRHDNEYDCEYIQLGIDFGKSKKVGEFNLCTVDDIIRVEAEIKQGRNK
jgi:hypothetical protein